MRESKPLSSSNVMCLRGGDGLKRRQRIRTCGNLLQLIEITKSDKLREIYRRQYVSLASRLKKNAA